MLTHNGSREATNCAYVSQRSVATEAMAASLTGVMVRALQ